MTQKHLFVAVPVALFILGSGVANAGKTVEERARLFA